MAVEDFEAITRWAEWPGTSYGVDGRYFMSIISPAGEGDVCVFGLIEAEGRAPITDPVHYATDVALEVRAESWRKALRELATDALDVEVDVHVFSKRGKDVLFRTLCGQEHVFALADILELRL